MNVHFYKFQGTGNDFILIDDREKTFPVEDTGAIARLCDRRFGIGADGLILLQPHPELDFYMQYFNSDGRESSMCGNGGRCIVAFANQIKVIGSRTRFMAIDGAHEAFIDGHRVELRMKDVTHIEEREDAVYIMNTGSPHYVQFLKEDALTADVVTMARKVRYSHEFKADGINVNYANVLGPATMHMRTYERGVEDETLSCGTGVTATSIALAFRNHFEAGNHSVHVGVMGGRLDVSYRFDPETRSATHVWLKGPALFVYDGIIHV